MLILVTGKYVLVIPELVASRYVEVGYPHVLMQDDRPAVLLSRFGKGKPMYLRVVVSGDRLGEIGASFHGTTE